MPQLRPSFGNEKIVPSILLVDVGSLRIRESGSIPDADGLRDVAGVKVDLLQHNADGVYPDGAIIVPEELSPC